jgi:uncharacterized protein (TIRG00374 family)
MKKRLASLLQLAIGIGLITLLFRNMDNKADLANALKAIASNWPYLVGATLAFLVCLSLCAWRWQLILKAHHMPVSFLQALELYFVGHFFNAFMFGSVGGDLVKVYFVAKLSRNKRAEAITTIFIDRAVGMLALIGLAAAIVALRWRFFVRYPETRVAMLFMIGATLAAITVLFVAFRRNVFEHWALFRRLEETTAVGKIISRVYSVFHDCFTHRGLLSRTLILSFMNHVAIVVAALLLGLGLNIRTVNSDLSRRSEAKSDPRPPAHYLLLEFANYLTVFPIVNGIAAIPATPGGLGTREYAAQFLLGVPEFGVPKTRSVPLSLLLYATTLFWSLIGGIVYAHYSIRAGKPTETELEELA